MIYDLFFYYRISEKAEFGIDENDNPCEVYCRIKLEECNTETRDKEKEEKVHNDVKTIAELLQTKPEYITPISKEEYDKNMEDES